MPYFKRSLIVLFVWALLVAKVFSQDGSCCNQCLFNCFNYAELVELLNCGNDSCSLNSKIDFVLNTPAVDNSIFSQSCVGLKCYPNMGHYVRVAAWNIGSTTRVEDIKNIFCNPECFISGLKTKKSAKIKKVREQVEILRNSDVILLNEVDSGMPRSDYKIVVAELAKVGGYNYAYGVEFIEIDPSHMGLQNYRWSEETELVEKRIIGEYKVDICKYKGLHGNAILSRFPLENVRVLGLPQPYDWYNFEKEKPSKMEIVRRHFAEKVFNENVRREVRIGGRMALIADIRIPGLNTPVTLVSVHFENRTTAKYRNEQLKFLLENICPSNPIILGGDCNTGCFSAAPFKKSGSEIAGAILGCIPETINIFRMYSNPTVKNVPVILPNCERCFFDTIQNANFDCRGQKEFSSNGRGGLFCDSNERGRIGFKPTYVFKRSFGLAKYKMDWIFVRQTTCSLTPVFGRTLYELNYLKKNPPSDHAPVTVDLLIDNVDK